MSFNLEKMKELEKYKDMSVNNQKVVIKQFADMGMIDITAFLAIAKRIQKEFNDDKVWHNGQWIAKETLEEIIYVIDMNDKKNCLSRIIKTKEGETKPFVMQGILNMTDTTTVGNYKDILEEK